MLVAGFLDLLRVYASDTLDSPSLGTGECRISVSLQLNDGVSLGFNSRFLLGDERFNLSADFNVLNGHLLFY